MITFGIYIGIVLVIILNNLKHRIIGSKNFFLIFIIGFFTTLPHEISHYIVALLLGGRPQGISLIPKKVETSNYTYWTFGSVTAQTNKFTGFFVGIAPAIYLVASYFVAKYYFYYYPAELKEIVLFFFIEWILIENGIPSKEDLKIAFSSYIGFLVFFSAILLVAARYY
jgi:hypothetical protein